MFYYKRIYLWCSHASEGQAVRFDIARPTNSSIERQQASGGQPTSKLGAVVQSHGGPNDGNTDRQQ